MSIYSKLFLYLLLSTLLLSCNAAQNSSSTSTWKSPNQSASQNNRSYGTINYDDGAKWVGQIKNGHAHGQGVYTWPDGNKYTGEIKRRELTGYGTLEFPDGNKYDGEWKNGFYHGQGTLTSPDGMRVTGNFKNSIPQGTLTVTFPDGKKGTLIPPEVTTAPQKQSVSQPKSSSPPNKSPRRRWSKPVE